MYSADRPCARWRCVGRTLRPGSAPRTRVCDLSQASPICAEVALPPGAPSTAWHHRHVTAGVVRMTTGRRRPLSQARRDDRLSLYNRIISRPNALLADLRTGTVYTRVLLNYYFKIRCWGCLACLCVWLDFCLRQPGVYSPVCFLAGLRKQLWVDFFSNFQGKLDLT